MEWRTPRWAPTTALACVGVTFAGCTDAVAAVDRVGAGCANGRVCTTLDAVQLFALADKLIEAGRWADAEATLGSLTRDNDKEVRAEARFRLGNLRRSRGDLPGAERAYRALLNEIPGANPVRVALAGVLAMAGQEAAASSQLRRASSAGLPEDVAREVDKLQLALRSRRRIGGNVAFGLAPDSNINRSTSEQTVLVGGTPITLSDEARARSGLGMTMNAQAYWRPALSAQVNMLFTVGGSADLYRQSEFNDVTTTISSGPEWLHGRMRLRPSALFGRRWFGGAHYSDTYGLTVNWQRQMTASSQVQLDLTALRTAYAVNPAMTGNTFSLVTRYDRAFSPRFTARITARVDRQMAREAAFSSWSAGSDALIVRDVGRVSAFANVGYGRTWGDASFNLPPARRNDQQLDIASGLLLRSLAYHGFAPLVQLHLTRNVSPVFLFNYRRVRVELRLTRDF